MSILGLVNTVKNYQSKSLTHLCEDSNFVDSNDTSDDILVTFEVAIAKAHEDVFNKSFYIFDDESEINVLLVFNTI
jgi:hypothetical protein